MPVSSSVKQIVRAEQISTVSSSKCWPLNLMEVKAGTWRDNSDFQVPVFVFSGIAFAKY